MWKSDSWQEYALLDAGDGMKLERWGDVILSRPEPQAVWRPQNTALWQNADAVYHRSSQGGGSWSYTRTLPESWQIRYGDLRFSVRPTGFKHTGLFPEQGVNWDWAQDRIRACARKVRILNLFAYTGGATLACAAAGAEVVHVDAAKGIVSWAKENAVLSGLADAPIRYLVDDALQFVRREERRGRRYDGIIMDPPSYGRGPDGQMFRFETHIQPLVEACAALLSDQPLFFILNSYTAGFAPAVGGNVLKTALPGGSVDSDNIALPLPNGMVLPCGATARWTP